MDEPVLRPILHPYPDALPDDALVQTYSIEELIAEKTRALYERSRPRDLYDVVYIISNSGATIPLAHARDVFGEKCVAKQIPTPTVAELVALVVASDEMRSEWGNMLAHQLPALPPIDGMLARLADVLDWLEPVTGAVVAAASLPPLALAPDQTILAPAPSRLWRVGIPVEAIRFAGANHLLIQFQYKGTLRTIEAYSLRRSTRGNTLLYGWELSTATIKAFDVAKISSVTTTTRTFVPRYRVEFTGSGTLNQFIPMTAAPTTRGFSRVARGAAPRGPVYIFRCPICQKEFRRRRNDGALRRHKMSDGITYCPSHRGYLEQVV